MRVWLFTVLLLAGCATQAPTPAPAQAKLSDAFSRGAASVQAGNYAAAMRDYEEARRLARSIEDGDGLGAAAVNLSIVQQRLGHDAQARETLAEVLDSSRGPAIPERRLMQAELRRSILSLAARDIPGAIDWAARAQQRCGSCALLPAILNVNAQAALAAKNLDEAARVAAAASDAAKARDDRAEAANALRTLGRARLAKNEAGPATAALAQALELDHGLADPRKIAADLAELARAQAAAGDPTAARSYFERALAVSRSLNDTRAVAELEAQMASSGSLSPVTDRKSP